MSFSTHKNERSVGRLADSVFPDYLEIPTAVLVPHGVGKISPGTYKALIFFHILVLREYWVLTESRIPLKPVLGCVRIVALSISSHEQIR